jgi:hypothetical protein
VINLINMIYVVVFSQNAYRNTLEHILVINLIYMYVVKCLVRILTYTHTLEYILVINLNNMLYIIMVKDFE